MELPESSVEGRLRHDSGSQGDSLIFGIRAVSALSDQALRLLADHVRQKNPRLAELLEKAWFADDLANSDKSTGTVMDIIKEANKLFESVGLQCKGWPNPGSNSNPDITDDGLTIGVGGMEWCPMIDTVKIPPLHLSKKTHGKIRVGTQVFDGTFKDLNKFIPQKHGGKQVCCYFQHVRPPYSKNCRNET